MAIADLLGDARRTAAILLPVLLLLALRSPAPSPPADVARQVEKLSSELHELQQQSAMPVLVLNRHRESICYLFGIYSFEGPEQVVGRKKMRTRFSGTGFVAAEGLVATNRHVAEPWFEDDEAEWLIARGARPRLEKLLAFFPGRADALELSQVRVSRDADVAVATYDVSKAHALRPLPLAAGPGMAGDPVIVVGYPMGVRAMVAKSPRPVYRRLVSRPADFDVARELAALSLIRPLATQGHLGDVVGDKLIYDAVTAQGGSGGPVFNHEGRVIGVNAAYLDGFSGSTIGVSVHALRPLLEKAQHNSP